MKLKEIILKDLTPIKNKSNGQINVSLLKRKMGKIDIKKIDVHIWGEERL